MAQFGDTSNRRLDTSHHIHQLLWRRVVAERDCSVTEGHRDKVKQNYYFKTGTSKVQWPDSDHNSIPSMAVDCVPYPELWSSKAAFFELREVVLAKWSTMEDEGLTDGYVLKWGGDWDDDGDFDDQTFNDYPHWWIEKG